LTDGQITDSDDCTIHAGIVLIETNHGFQDGWISLSCFRIKIDHDASFIPQRDAHSASLRILSEDHDFADPMVLLEWFISVGLNEDIWSESTDIKIPAGFSFDLETRGQSDQRNAGLIEDALIELHQLDLGAVTSRDLCT
jgi:hypothetical protein